MKNCIAVLTKGYKRLRDYDLIIQRNKAIYTNIIANSKELFDVIIFHEGNISYEQQRYIQNHSSPIKLIFIDLSTNKKNKAFDNKNVRINFDLCPPNSKSNRYSIGYKHMCHFWSIDFIDYLQEYRYVLRIDEDCVVKYFDPITLQHMSNNEIYFCSPEFVTADNNNYIVGLKNFWLYLIEKYSIVPFSKKFEYIIYPYTNFMIWDMNIIKTNLLINQLLLEVDECGCIYSNRWGDLPIWGMIICTLFDKKHYHWTKNISYYHGSHEKIINRLMIKNIQNSLSDIFLN